MSDPADARSRLEQIRSLLFGGQMQEVQRRLEALEVRLTQQVQSVLDRVEQRVADLERDAPRQVDQLRTLFAEERASIEADVREQLASFSTSVQERPGREELSTLLRKLAQELQG